MKPNKCVCRKCGNELEIILNTSYHGAFAFIVENKVVFGVSKIVEDKELNDKILGEYKPYASLEDILKQERTFYESES